MLEDAAHQNFEHIVSWVDGGQRFRIHNPQALTEILGQYFNQTKYKSFLRQLQNYGFTRILRGPMKGVCSHKDFVRSNRAKCQKMRRHTPTSRSRSPSPILMGKTHETKRNKMLTSGMITTSSSSLKVPTKMMSLGTLPIGLWDMTHLNALTELPNPLVAAATVNATEMIFHQHMEKLPESGMFEGRKFFLINPAA